MEFLKDLLQIQHQQTLEKLANTLLSRKEDKEEFIDKFNKPNYILIKVSNTTMNTRKRVKIDELISSL
tara:strand:+ start:337 stop:540 length:204 start_codon:yes stop_codon:yes gene_type:complete